MHNVPSCVLTMERGFCSELFGATNFSRQTKTHI